ncbi:hypothetical protein WR25_21339 [Diploscapter pachys]|uniref:Uncharacterized protein n=1 Tax=Diploscapter pachys TaxID=2018661 RepID=A0A2A2KQC6_9BILA|nr:hypothetical protein WR25_21339 [Diploscapter pachys]
MDDNRMRNLSVKQTLDELLGISREPNNKPSTSGTSGLINGLFDSSMRPPTRHGGRDSVSSNEENRDPSTSLSASYQKDKEKQERTLRRDKSLNDSDDDFIRRLSEMRKQTSLGSGRSMTGGTSVIRTEKRQSNTSTIEETEEHLPLPFDNPSEVSPSSESKNETYRITSSESETKTEPKPSKTEEAPKPKERQKSAPVPAVRRKSLPKKTEKPAVARIERTGIPSEDNATFRVWQQKVDEREREQRKSEKEENDRKKKDQQEKKLLAQKQFERWKEDRDAIDKERRLKEKQKKMKEAERVRAEKESKKKDAEKAFESWKKERLNKKKDEEKKTMQQLQQHLKNKLDEEEINDYKRLLADEAYQTWLQLKEADALRQETASEHQTQLTPWIPPNNTVPRQFVPTEDIPLKEGQYHIDQPEPCPERAHARDLHNEGTQQGLAIFISVHAGQAYYKIQGHYAGVTVASIYGKEKIRSAFLPEEQKIASELARILGNDYSDFYVQYFEIHGEDAGFPTTIYFGYLSTNDQNNRDDLISKLQADKDMMLYFMMSMLRQCQSGRRFHETPIFKFKALVKIWDAIREVNTRGFQPSAAIAEIGLNNIVHTDVNQDFAAFLLKNGGIVRVGIEHKTVECEDRSGSQGPGQSITSPSSTQSSGNSSSIAAATTSSAAKFRRVILSTST